MSATVLWLAIALGISLGFNVILWGLWRSVAREVLAEKRHFWVSKLRERGGDPSMTEQERAEWRRNMRVARQEADDYRTRAAENDAARRACLEREAFWGAKIAEGSRHGGDGHETS